MGKDGYSENEIQKQCESYLNELGIKYIPRYNENMKKRNIGIRKDLKGFPDIIAFFPMAILLVVEIKTPEKYKLKDNNRSQDQLAWAEYMKRNTYVYHCIDSFEIFKKIVDDTLRRIKLMQEALSI